jgi:hypothetical protein
VIGPWLGIDKGSKSRQERRLLKNKDCSPLVLKRVRTVRGDDQKIGLCPKPLRSSKQVGIGLQWNHRGSIIAHHKRWAAMVIDDHWRVAAIAVLWDEALSNVMDAPLKVHRRLWAKPPRIPMVLKIDLLAAVVCEQATQRWR